MSTATSPSVRIPRASSSARDRLRARRIPMPKPELLALVVLAAVLDLWALDKNGWANTYYSAAIKSMSTSWHNFLYNSFDVAGLQTLDKPPLAMWVEALSVRVFGFSSWAMLEWLSTSANTVGSTNQPRSKPDGRPPPSATRAPSARPLAM